MKRSREEERIKIVIRYRDRHSVIKIKYDESKRKLRVFAIANETINVEMLPKDVPERELVKKALQSLDNSYGRGVVLKTSFVLDGVVAFLQLPDFVPIFKNKKVKWKDAINNDIFIQILLPLLSYKEILALEGASKEIRWVVVRFDVWKILFQRDFPEIYHPDIFSAEILAHVPKPDYLKFLDSISNPPEKRAFGYKRPYWKLLYEYQLKNKFSQYTYQHDSDDDTMLTHCVAFGRRDCLMLRDGNLEFQLIGGHTLKKIPSTNLYRAVEELKGGNWMDVENFEKNNLYIFVRVSNLAETFSCISDIKGNIIDRLDLDDSYDGGLIGDDFCYFNNTITSEKYRLRHMIDPEFQILTCYNTRSDCFLLIHRDFRVNEIQLCKATKDGHRLLTVFTPIKAFNLKSGIFTFNERWLVYCIRTKSKIKIRSTRNSSVQKIMLPFNGSRITEMCIVGDYLHYFSVSEEIHNIYNLKTKKQNEYSTNQIVFNHVRMSFMGPILCASGGPEFLWGDDPSNKLKLLGGSCNACGTSSPQYTCGNRCGAQYCDTQCQTHDWKNSHSLICARGGGGKRQRKIHKVMTEFKEGRLKTSAGKTVTDRKQALAIALSEANELK